jgi:hypothetical protein
MGNYFGQYQKMLLTLNLFCDIILKMRTIPTIFQNPNTIFKYFAPLNSCELVYTYEEFTLLNWETTSPISMRYNHIIIYDDRVVEINDIKDWSKLFPQTEFEITSTDKLKNYTLRAKCVVQHDSSPKFINVSIQQTK